MLLLCIDSFVSKQASCLDRHLGGRKNKVMTVFIFNLQDALILSTQGGCHVI